MRAAFVRKDEQDMFDGMQGDEKDPRKALHVGEVPIPPLGPNECLIAVMASAINYNTVWTSIFEPLPTFKFLERFGRESELGARQDLDGQGQSAHAQAASPRLGGGRVSGTGVLDLLSDARIAKRRQHEAGRC